MEERQNHSGYERIARMGILNSCARQLSDDIRGPLGLIRNFAMSMAQDDTLRATHGEYVDAILQGSQALHKAVLDHIGFVDAATRQGDAAAMNHSPSTRL